MVLSRKIIVVAAVSYFVFISSSVAGKPIRVTIDFNEGSYQEQAASNDKTVVIDTVVVDRVQPAASGERVDIDLQYADSQIGWINHRGSEYIVVLKNATLEKFAREAVTLAFEKSGYRVVAVDNIDANVLHFDVTVSELWMWLSPIEGSNRKQFHFAMTTNVTSNTDGVQDLGSVRVQDYRNGSKPTSWKSYRNTIMHSMKVYIKTFGVAAERLENPSSNTTQSNKGVVKQDSGNDYAGLAESLKMLDELKSSGVIDDTEYQQLRRKAIEEYL